MRTSSKLALKLLLIALSFLQFAIECFAQTAPARDFVYMGSKLIAVENRNIIATNRDLTDLDYVPPPTGMRQVSMKFRATDPDGGANVSQINVIVSHIFSNMRGCYFYYLKPTNTIYLNDGLPSSLWLEMALDNTTGSGYVENDYCRINRATTSATVTGDRFELNADIVFKPFMGGALNVWTWARDYAGEDIGWEFQGNYSPTNLGGPTNLTFQPYTPARRTTLRFRVTDPDGARNVFQLNVMISNNGFSNTGCYFVYQAVSNIIDLNNGLAPPNENWITMALDPGGSASIENGYCILRRIEPTANHATIYSQYILEVAFDVEFKTTLLGTPHMWSWTRDMALSAYGWVDHGTITVP